MLLQGRRINAFIPQIGVRRNGILGAIHGDPKTKRKQWWMVADQRSEDFGSFPEIGIKNSTIFVDRSYGSDNDIQFMDESSASTWANVPINVGVYTTRLFEYDGVLFPPGMVGRVVCFTSSVTIRALWRFPTLSDMPERIPADKKFPHLNGWQVPSEHVSIGTVNLLSGQVINDWKSDVTVSAPSKPKFCIGDIVTYVATRPYQIQVVGKDYHVPPINMTRGTILTVEGVLTSFINATVVGNCRNRMIGSSVTLDTRLLDLFPFPWFPKGKKVRVTWELMFQKRSLQDQIGVVLSSTDQDGDVGVQFPEDIGAGSLDGLGPDGRCLFVPSKALEISE
jgi:hypothetical protein